MRRPRIGVLGLGYVGLPLAAAFGEKYPTIGFDINTDRVAELRRGVDRTREVSAAELKAAKRLTYTTELEDLHRCTVFIVTVPTPVDRHNRPDLRPLERACTMVSGLLKRGDTVIFESTVYPGCTEEMAVPLLQQGSGLTYNRDFTCAYSPERVNPGDKHRRLKTIRKITSGSTPEAAARVDRLYRTIITAGTFKASSIGVAEAAKVIENTQRDLNIALMNELALIFERMGLDTQEVLQAAGTKWNFLKFQPGLVGGHCIGVDPYYLTHRAQELGYHPEIVLAGRRLNDAMPRLVAERVILLMARRRLRVAGARVLVLGLTFKENCPDIRNAKVVDVIRTLQGHGVRVDCYDPWADRNEVHHEYGLKPLARLPRRARYDAVVVAVAHDQFRRAGAAALRRLGRRGHVLFDIKGIFPAALTDGRL